MERRGGGWPELLSADSTRPEPSSTMEHNRLSEEAWCPDRPTFKTSLEFTDSDEELSLMEEGEEFMIEE